VVAVRGHRRHPGLGYLFGLSSYRIAEEGRPMTRKPSTSHQRRSAGSPPPPPTATPKPLTSQDRTADLITSGRGIDQIIVQNGGYLKPSLCMPHLTRTSAA
jgi:hypothetical protein